MAVPLFDTVSPVAPLRAEIDARDRARARRRRRTSSGRRSRRSSASSRRTSACGTSSASRTGPTRSRSRCRRSASARATRSSCRPSPSTRARRRSRRPAPPPVFCDVDPETMCVTAETVRAALTPRTRAVIAVDLFGNVRADPGDRGARRAGAWRTRRRRRGRGCGGRAPPARSATSRRSRSSPRRTSAASATAARSRPTTTRSPTPRACCASTARATRSPTSGSAGTRGSTSCRRRSCACCCRGSTAGRRAAARPRAHYADAGLGELVALPVATAGAAPAWHLFVVRHARAAELDARPDRGRHRRARLLPHAAAPPGGARALGPAPGSRCRSPTRSPARTSRSR